MRIPAAFCGCVGFKPSYGRISTAGLLGASTSFDHSGILARTVADARLIYRECAGYDAADPTTIPMSDPVTSPKPSPGASPLRIGVPRNYFFDGVASDVARAVATAIDGFRSLKAEVREIAFPIAADTIARGFDPIVVAEIHERFARDWKSYPDAFSQSFTGFFEAPVPTGLELAAAHRALGNYQRAVRELFNDVDIVLTPTVPVNPPAIDGPIPGALILRNTWPFNAARTPAISIPCGLDAHGLPIGLQMVGAPFAEDTVLRAAHEIEQLNNWHRFRPPSGD